MTIEVDDGVDWAGRIGMRTDEHARYIQHLNSGAASGPSHRLAPRPRKTSKEARNSTANGSNQSQRRPLGTSLCYEKSWIVKW